MHTNPVGFSPLSHIASLETSPVETHTPAPYVPTPPKLSALRLIAEKERSQKLGDDLLNILTDRLSQVKHTLRSISAQQIEKLKESAERAKNSDFWSTLKKLATCLLSAFSSIAGISMLATGGSALIGGAMIASGVLSLANFALSETNTWDWVAKYLAENNEDRQKKLAVFIPAAVGIACGAIGIAGAGWHFATHSGLFMEKILSVAQASLNLFDGATAFGKGQADARLLWAQADLNCIKGNLTIEQAQCDSLLQEVEYSLSTFRNASTSASRALNKIIQTNSSILKTV